MSDNSAGNALGFPSLPSLSFRQPPCYGLHPTGGVLCPLVLRQPAHHPYKPQLVKEDQCRKIHSAEKESPSWLQTDLNRWNCSSLAKRSTKPAQPLSSFRLQRT